MACSRCGAPLEFANGVPAACHFCGSVERAPEAAPPTETTGLHAGGSPTYGGVAETPDDGRGDFGQTGAFETRSSAGPPPYVPSASGSVVGKIVMLAAIVLGAVVVFSIVASSGSSERHHPSHSHHHGR